MTHVDDRKGPTRAKRSTVRANARALNHGGDSRVAARAGRAVPTKDVAGSQLESEADRAERLAAGKRSAGHGAGHGASHSGRTKSKRSHAAVGAAIVAGTAMVATFAFILTNGNSSSTPQSGANPIPAPQTSAPPKTKSAAAAPAAVNTIKADRKPPAAKPSTAKTTETRTSATPNTGPTTPVFRRGQWIAVLDKYPTDAGMDAEQLAKQLAAKLIAAGVPGRAMLLNGQYPGIANSSLEPETGEWVVYLAALPSAEAALNLCQAPKTQATHPNIACPTYEPAAKPG
ncbi:MAG: hypothetical protein QOH84_3448 [Kribbellaceae bacterium]|nr:hypothetical protein [Kribbellaceae bacterium]